MADSKWRLDVVQFGRQEYVFTLRLFRNGILKFPLVQDDRFEMAARFKYKNGSLTPYCLVKSLFTFRLGY